MSPLIRGQALQGLESLGIVFDEKKNEISRTRNAETEITGEGSRIRIFVIPTDEELVFVEDTVALIEGRYDVHTNFEYSFQKPDYKNLERAGLLEKELRKIPELSQIILKPSD